MVTNLAGILLVMTMAFVPSRMAIPSDTAPEPATSTEFGRTPRDLRSSGQMFVAYAPPMSWGAWTVIDNHFGVRTVRINVDPVGKTLIVGQVQYYDYSGTLTVLTFVDSVTITTGKCIANISVRFKGNPFGAAVKGVIEDIHPVQLVPLVIKSQ